MSCQLKIGKAQEEASLGSNGNQRISFGHCISCYCCVTNYDKLSDFVLARILQRNGTNKICIHV